jgi:carboxymethylenebutenolidase
MNDFPTRSGNSRGYLAIPENNTGPGVLVLHAWWGLNDFFTGLCDRLASQGFVAFAPDLYGDGVVVATIEGAQQRLNALDNERAAAIVEGAADYLHTHPAVNSRGIGVIGFSLGAAWGSYLSAVRPDTVAAVVIFYGATEADWAAAKATYLIQMGENDEDMEWLPQMEAAMRAAGRDVTTYTYAGAGHWFFEEDRPGHYDDAASDLAWERTLTFLRSQLNQPKA